MTMGPIAYITVNGGVSFGKIPLSSLTGTVRYIVSSQLWMRLFLLVNSGRRTVQLDAKQGNAAGSGLING